MAITGHKTRSIFDRYAIVNENDTAEAMSRLQEHVSAQPIQSNVVALKGVSRRFNCEDKHRTCTETQKGRLLRSERCQRFRASAGAQRIAKAGAGAASKAPKVL